MSADYHAKMQQMLFNRYTNPTSNVAHEANVTHMTNQGSNAPIATTTTATTTMAPTMNTYYPHPNTNHTSEMNLLTPNIYEYKSNVIDNQGGNDVGYFSTRAAVSVPSSRIDSYNSNNSNTFEEEIDRFTKEHDPNVIPIHGFNHHQELFDGQSTIDNLSLQMPIPPPPPQLQLQQQPIPTLPQQAALPLPPHQQPMPPPPVQPSQPVMQFYDTTQEFVEPMARPQPHRQNTAPASSLSIQNLQQHQLQHQLQQQQQQQTHYNQHQKRSSIKSSDMGLTNRHLNAANDHLHARRESFSHETKPKIKKGRPRKKPVFHLQLDNVKKCVPTITSSQSDSGTDYWNRTPSGHVRRRLASTTMANLANGSNLKSNEDDLKIADKDLSFADRNFAIPTFNLTPSMDPPGNPNGYFELNNTPGVNENLATSGGYFSPAINDNSVNNFNKTFEDYLQEAEKLSDHKGTGDSNNENIANVNQADVVDLQQDTLVTNFTELDIPQNQNMFTPLNFESSIGDDFLSSENEAQLDRDRLYSNEITPQYLTVGSGDEEDDQRLDFRLQLPTLQKTVSSQSGHSPASVGSDLVYSASTGFTPPTTSTATATNTATTTLSKPLKKRVSKGAVCSVCDKYISRDIARHMRIHDEVGRFQCVYPKSMCNHKTQNFNRPYDYKKHLLHLHFVFDDPKGKTANTLTDKLPIMGTCEACGARMIANDWLESHILTKDPKVRCPYSKQS